MDDLKSIINPIIKGCLQAGIEVPEVLAAFVARTIVETDASTFALDKKVTPEKTQEVILLSIQKLLEKDSPALEMIKMQVDYDSVYLREENEAHNKSKARSRMINIHKSAISEIEMEDSSDYEALTTLYRKIFRFLIEFAPNSKTSDREVEREIAAALESVFPRVGLKAFIQLNYEEKISQLLELARIILGIRLFNRDEGRGGAGIDDMDKDSNILAKVLSTDIDREVVFFSDACAKYQKAIIKAHLQRRKRLHEQELEERRREELIAEDEDSVQQPQQEEGAALSTARSGGSAPIVATTAIAHSTADIHNSVRYGQEAEVTDKMIERWSQELANRRQYLGFLRTLQDEAKYLLQNISTICEKIRIELSNVRSLVSNKNSVPKEVVYPRFDALGTLWVQLFDEVLTMIARSNTFQTLCKYRLSFNPTLTENYYTDSITAGGNNSNQQHQQQELSLSDGIDINSIGATTTAGGSRGENTVKSISRIASAGGTAPTTSRKKRNKKKKKQQQEGKESQMDEDGNVISTEQDEDIDNADASDEEGGGDDDDDDEDENNEEQRMAEQAAAMLGLANNNENTDRRIDETTGLEEHNISGATLLSVQNTPDFMLLPLEMQGYCPWTIIEARGLLVPGKPALGIVRYENLYYVFDHILAIKAFMHAPDHYLAAIKEKALRCPEFIHLLRLHRWFPTASIARLLKIHEIESSNKTGMPLTKDASTGTPTHFVESYIDINYHWNEWELRRRALKIVNLKNCVTTSQQTDQSNYRRDNETQVYPHRIKGTQTKRDKGTNPPTVTTFVAGFRGKQLMSKGYNNNSRSNSNVGSSSAVLMKNVSSNLNNIAFYDSNGNNSNNSGSNSIVAGSDEMGDDDDNIEKPRVLTNPPAGVVTLTLDL